MTKKVGVDVLPGSVVRVREMSHFKVNSELVGGERAGTVALVRLRVPVWYSLYLLYLYRRTNTDAKCCGKRAPAAAVRTRALNLLPVPVLRAAAYVKQNDCL